MFSNLQCFSAFTRFPSTVSSTCWTVLASQESLVAGRLNTPVAPLLVNQYDFVGLPPSSSHYLVISFLDLYITFFFCRWLCSELWYFATALQVIILRNSCW